MMQTSYEKCAVWALLMIICDSDGLIRHSEPGGMSLGVFSHQQTKMLTISKVCKNTTRKHELEYFIPLC